MWKINPEKIKEFGADNEIIIIKTGFLHYAAVQKKDGLVIAKGLRLRKFYNKELLPGCIWKDGGDGLYTPITKYVLRLENPKNFDERIDVCSWDVYIPSYLESKVVRTIGDYGIYDESLDMRGEWFGIFNLKTREAPHKNKITYKFFRSIKEAEIYIKANLM